MEFKICMEEYRKESFMKNDKVFFSNGHRNLNSMIKRAKALAHSGFFVDEGDYGKVKCYVCKSSSVLMDDENNHHHESNCWYSRLYKDFSEIHEVRPFERYTHLYFEVNRLFTFKDWPITWLSPFEMARSGFYFTRNKDHAACAFCGGVIGAWEREDTAEGQHKLHFPRCKFMNKEPVGNVPISVSQILEKKRSQATIHQHPRVREAPHVTNSAETVVHFNNLQKNTEEDNVPKENGIHINNVPENIKTDTAPINQHQVLENGIKGYHSPSPSPIKRANPLFFMTSNSRVTLQPVPENIKTDTVHLNQQRMLENGINKNTVEDNVPKENGIHKNIVEDNVPIENGIYKNTVEDNVPKENGIHKNTVEDEVTLATPEVSNL